MAQVHSKEEVSWVDTLSHTHPSGTLAAVSLTMSCVLPTVMVVQSAVLQTGCVCVW